MRATVRMQTALFWRRSAGKTFFRGSVLDGVEFQRKIERAAYAAAGCNYAAPAQRLEDFTAGRESRKFGEVLPTYAAGTALCDLNGRLPA